MKNAEQPASRSISRPNSSVPTPTMITVWTSAISSRTRMFDPTSCQRRSGVAPRRLRISFSRSATSGIAANTPSCMSDIARIDGIEVREEVEVVRLDRLEAGERRPAGRSTAWFTAPRTNPTSWRVRPSDVLWLGSV